MASIIIQSKEIRCIVNMKQAVTMASSYIYNNVDKLNNAFSPFQRRCMNFLFLVVYFYLF